jgi:hypothetical protein
MGDLHLHVNTEINMTCSEKGKGGNGGEQLFTAAFNNTPFLGYMAFWHHKRGFLLPPLSMATSEVHISKCLLVGMVHLPFSARCYVQSIILSSIYMSHSFALLAVGLDRK